MFIKSFLPSGLERLPSNANDYGLPQDWWDKRVVPVLTNDDVYGCMGKGGKTRAKRAWYYVVERMLQDQPQCQSHSSREEHPTAEAQVTAGDFICEMVRAGLMQDVPKQEPADDTAEGWRRFDLLVFTDLVMPLWAAGAGNCSGKRAVVDRIHHPDNH